MKYKIVVGWERDVGKYNALAVSRRLQFIYTTMIWRRCEVSLRQLFLASACTQGKQYIAYGRIAVVFIHRPGGWVWA